MYIRTPSVTSTYVQKIIQITEVKNFQTEEEWDQNGHALKENHNSFEGGLLNSFKDFNKNIHSGPQKENYSRFGKTNEIKLLLIKKSPNWNLCTGQTLPLWEERISTQQKDSDDIEWNSMRIDVGPTTPPTLWPSAVRWLRVGCGKAAAATTTTTTIANICIDAPPQPEQ